MSKKFLSLILLKFLGSKILSFIKIGVKISIQRGTLLFQKKILSLILLKICVSDPETISISNFNFPPNRTQIFFADPKGGPFYVKKNFVSNFACL